MENDSQELKQSLFAVSEAVLGAGILVAVGTWGGGWLDEKLHTGPWFSIGLSLLGAGLGLTRLVIKAQSIGQSSSRETRSNAGKKLPPSLDDISPEDD